MSELEQRLLSLTSPTESTSSSSEEPSRRGLTSRTLRLDTEGSNSQTQQRLFTTLRSNREAGSVSEVPRFNFQRPLPPPPSKLASSTNTVARPVTGLRSSRSSRSTTEYAHILANSDSSRSKTFTGSVREATGFDPSPVLPQSTRKVKKLTLKPGVAFSNGGNGSDGLTKLASKLSEIKLKPGVALTSPVRLQAGSHQVRRQRIDKRGIIRHENQQLADDEEMSGEERLSRLVLKKVRSALYSDPIHTYEL